MTLRKKTLILVVAALVAIILPIYFFASSQLWLRLAIGLAMAVMAVIMVLFLEKQILSRLAHLNKNVSRIGASHDLSARVSMPGTDELSSLAKTINGTLTALQQSQSKLQESEERYRQLFEQLNDAALLADTETGRILDANKQAEILLGRTRDEIIGMHQTEVHPPGMAEEYRQKFASHVERGRAADYDGEIIRKDGSIVPVSIGAAPVTIGGKRLILGLFHDITKRRKGEEALLKYRMAVEASADVITVVNSQYVYLLANQTLLKYQCLTEGQVIGHTSAEVLGEELFKNMLKPNVDRCLQGETVEYEVELHYKRVGKRWMDMFYSPLKDSDGRVIGIVAIGRDVTERRQAEALSRTLAEHSPIGVYIIQDRKFQYVNQAFAKATGYTPEQLLGKNPPDLVLPKDRGQVSSNAISMLKGGLSHLYEYRAVNSAGEVKWAMETVVSIQYQGKQATLGNFMDITEQKRAQEQLKAAYAEEMELRQKLEAEINKRAEFTRALVHELKSPLTPVLASSELLASELQQEPWLSLAKNIYRGASQLNDRIDELLDIARGEVGMLKLKLGAVAPLPLLNDGAQDITPMISAQGQSLLVELPHSLAIIQADEIRLRQVLLNLLTNASKFTPRGGKITLRAKEGNNFLIIQVQDTGVGMSPEDQQRLFNPYSRLEEDRERLSGLGLGLSLCKMLVELHGGKIWVESEKGKGSTFSFSVPLDDTNKS